AVSAAPRLSGNRRAPERLLRTHPRRNRRQEPPPHPDGHLPRPSGTVHPPPAAPPRIPAPAGRTARLAPYETSRNRETATMAKKRPQTKAAKRPQLTDGEIPVVGAREPCPCGSGRRYKACHGRAAAHAVTELVHRPFEGLAGECDWVALRELMPAATAALTLKDGLPEGVPSVTLATVLPMAWPALRRDDGSVLIGLQNDTSAGDISRDLADTLQRALDAAPGQPVQGRRAPADGPRLQDLLDPEAAFEPVVHSGFEFWVPDSENATPE